MGKVVEDKTIPTGTFSADNTGENISNDTATQETTNNYLICDRTGFKVPISEGLVQEWTGLMVRAQSWEARHPQEFARALPDTLISSPRPEPADILVSDTLYDRTISPALEALGFTEHEASVQLTTYITSAVGSITLTDVTTALDLNFKPPTASIVFTEQTPNIPKEVVAGEVESLELTDNTADVALVIDSSLASLELTGIAPTSPNFPVPSITDGVAFASDVLSADSFTASANKTGLLSLWIYVPSGSGILEIATGKVESPAIGIIGIVINGSAGPSLQFNSGAAASYQLVILDEEISTINEDAWNHLLFSFDSSVPESYMYINDSLESSSGDIFNTDGVVAWDEVFSFEISPSLDTFDLAEFYLTNEYLDISVTANRRKFISAAGAPVDLGSDGSTPTGTQPLVYLSGTAAYWNLGLNFGSSGSFTMSTGSVADSSNDPPTL